VHLLVYVTLDVVIENGGTTRTQGRSEEHDDEGIQRL
jgi:hypothetical protein